jgi:UDP-N-acetylglucosamine 2-epimerase (non-hydrolysing)
MAKKILIVFGTRPEAIKMAPVVIRLKSNPLFTIKICVTAQHREMLDQVLKFFKLTPDYDLNLMKPNQSLNQLSANILAVVDGVLEDYSPDTVLVHGDTTTSSMTALASFHRQIPIAHVEAGLRTYNKKAPFPEEMNRQITGRIVDYHFAPTQQAANNLILNEHVDASKVYITGNTVIDALFVGIEQINENRSEIVELSRKINTKKKVILITGHRRENFGSKMVSFCKALKKISKREDVQLIYPVHLNPNVQDTVYRMLGNCENIVLIKPLDYEVFLWLMHKSYVIITDSGGIQEEAPSLNKPVLVTRDVTERQEAVDVGCVKLVGTSEDKIVKEVEKLLNDTEYYNRMISIDNPYGDGTASSKINTILEGL